MKKIVFILFTAIISISVNAQIYAQYDLGLAVQSSSTQSLLTSLHIGYQFNEVLTENGVLMIEYNQRTLLEELSSGYFGGRIGYGINTGRYTTLSAWGDSYYKLVSNDGKQLNHQANGEGISFLWKNVSVNIDYIEFLQASVGCYYLFD
jgi:hypothetical protein